MLASDRETARAEHNLNFDFVRRQAAEQPHWSNDVLLSWEQLFTPEKQAFLTHHYWTDSGSVNVFRVVGTDHWDYQGKTWFGFLTSGKRMQRNLQALEDNPSYYLQPVRRQPSIHYNTLDGLDYYVGTDGNHRTCIARFFLAESQQSQLHNVTINHYKIDEAFLQSFQRLRDLIHQARLPIVLEPARQTLGREDTAGWKMDRYAPSLCWHQLTDGEKIRLNADQTLEKLEALQAKHSACALPPPSLLRRFGSFLRRA